MVTCGVCGEPVQTNNEGTAGIIIEFQNYIPDYTEKYGFCQVHKPDDLEVAKQRIKQGYDSVFKCDTE